MTTLARNRSQTSPEIVLGFRACSLCLRVHDGSAWVEAAEMIRRLRTYDLPHAVHLESGICDGCAEELAARRSAV
jgi:hypothetical protein